MKQIGSKEKEEFINEIYSHESWEGARSDTAEWGGLYDVGL